jgi:hypothetical protein
VLQLKAYGTWDPINPGESELYGLDFTKELRAGDSVNGATWTCTVAKNGGADLSPQDHVIANQGSGLSGNISAQRIAGTLPFVLYILTATATTALGDTIKLWGYLPSFPPGAQIPTPR